MSLTSKAPWWLNLSAVLGAVALIAVGTAAFQVQSSPGVTGGSSTGGTGTVTNVATTGPITGGPFTTSGTIGCATCAVGTITANSGTAGAVGTFAANGGSTTIAPDQTLVNASGVLTIGAVGATSNGQATLVGLTSGSQNIHCSNNTCTGVTAGGAWAFGSSLTLTGHLNQSSANQWAGSCTMATTTCTFTIATTFTNYLSIVSIDHASAPPATANSAVCSISGTTVTITAGISNTLTWDCVLIGNPN